MLIRFVVSNFLSFDEEREFNMLAGSFKTHKHHIIQAKKVNILKSTALYGANGAGKSNFIKAIEFLQEAISNGGISKSVNNKKFKLNPISSSKPMTFEIEISTNNKIFSYGVSFDHTLVVEEWLYESGVNTGDKMIFERKTSIDLKHEIKIANKYKKTQKQKLLIELMEDSLLNPSELFLSKSENLKIADISSARESIEEDIIIIHPTSKFQMLVPALTQSKEFKIFANNLLEKFDTGVSELDIETIDFEKYFGEDDETLKKDIKEDIENGDNVVIATDSGGVIALKEKNKFLIKKVISQHINNSGQKVPFELTEESDGTQRLLDFIPAFIGILNDEVTFIIDEIDQSIHPTLLKALIQKVLLNEKIKGQLIFTTHESNLLDFDIFRQDEIWFVEKNETGSTEMYSLSDFKPRYDLDIRKGYLKGRFGAIPFLADLDNLNWDSYNA